MDLEERYIQLLEDQHAEVEAELKAEIATLKGQVINSYWSFLDADLDKTKNTCSGKEYNEHCAKLYSWWGARPFRGRMPHELWQKILDGKESIR